MPLNNLVRFIGGTSQYAIHKLIINYVLCPQNSRTPTIVEGKPSINISEQLIESRQAYQEAMHGFDALKHALERGYFLIGSEEEMMMSKEPGTENQF